MSSPAFATAMKASGTVKVEPIPLRASVAPSDPYPLNMLGPIAGPAAEAIATRVQLPEALAAHSVLASMSLAVQGHVQVRFPTQEIKPPSLFLTSVADSGERKTAADKLASGPIEDYERDLLAEYQSEKMVFDASFSIWKSNKDAVVKECKGRDPAFIREEIGRLEPEPRAPMQPMFIVPANASTQGVIWALEHGRPSVGLFHNDGGAWLGGWAMQDENLTGTITAYSDLWDGKTIKTLTKGEGMKYLPGRAFSFHVMFQSHYVGRMFGNAEMREQGFLARMLAVAPESKMGERFHDVNATEPPEIGEAIEAYHQRLDRIIRSPLPISPDHHNSLDRGLANFDQQATALYWEFYNSVEAQLGKDGPLRDIRGFAAKAAEHAGRLAAVIHVFHFGLRPPVLIGPDAMSAGIGLMNYYIGEALRLAAHGEDDEATTNAEQVSDMLAKWPRNVVGLPEIQDASRLGRKLKAAGLREVCRVLEQHDHISKIEGGEIIEGRRFKEAWRIHVGR